MAQVVEYLPSNHKALSSTLSPQKKCITFMLALKSIMEQNNYEAHWEKVMKMYFLYKM
jgi:hypothetical protein